MRRSIASAAAALLLPCAFSACASSGGAEVLLREDTTAPTLVEEAYAERGERRIEAEVAADGVVLRLGTTEIRLLGATAYRGTLGVARGDVVAGALRVIYDRKEAIVRGPFGGGAFELRPDLRVDVDPSGAIRNR